MAIENIILSIIVIFCVIALIFTVALYLLTAIALYLLAKDRGIKNPWMGFIPFCDCLLLGKLSEDVYFGKKKVPSPGLWLMLGNIIVVVFSLVQLFFSFYQAFSSISAGSSLYAMHFQFGYLLFSMLISVLSLALTGYIGFILYNLFKKYDEKNAIIFAVLSCIFSVTLPFFLFYVRNKYNKKTSA